MGKIFCIVFCFVLAGAANAEWVQIELTKKPYIDPRTGKAVNIEGRRNRPHIDPFEGGGHTGYPAVDNARVIERHQKESFLLIKTDAEELSTKGEVLTDAEAERTKKEVFGIVASEAGVTE